MKSTGITRKLDELGRVVLPIELRRSLGINNGDAVEIFVDGDKIILKKYKANMTCIVTGEVDDNNTVLPNGMVVSAKGAQLLITQLQGVINK